MDVRTAYLLLYGCLRCGAPPGRDRGDVLWRADAGERLCECCYVRWRERKRQVA